MNPGLASSCYVDPFGVFICPVLLSNNKDDDDDDDNNNNNNNNNSNNYNYNNKRTDIVTLEKEGRVCFIVNVACPFDIRVAKKEREKIDRFKDLKVEVPIKI